MTDSLHPHLADETLNEFLDQALEEPARAAAAEHLAACAACSTRLEALRVVFSELADLPPAPLGRDLRLGVLSAVRAQRPAQIRPIADPKRPAFQAIVALQLFATLALLAFAWPFAASLALPARLFGASGFGTGAFGTGNIAANLAGAWMGFSGLWPALQHWLEAVATQAALPFAELLPPIAASVVLAAAGLFWLFGNALLLRPGPAPRLRRPS